MKRRPLICALWLSLLTSPGLACTLCESETAQQVRAEIFNHHFPATMATVLAPFAVVILVLLGINRALRNY
jgi:hypothetical protein